MRALVTGGNGFIGSEVVRLLLARGDESVVFHRSANTERLSDIAAKISFLRGDLGNFSHVLDAVKKSRPNVIYHLGAMLSIPSNADPQSALQANVLGTYHVLEAARLFDVPQVLFATAWGCTATIFKKMSSTTIRCNARNFSMALPKSSAN